MAENYKRKLNEKENVIDPRQLTLTESICEYFTNSSLHGLKYIGTTEISVFERVFFTLSFVLVTVLSAFFISNVWQKWNETPVIIGMNPTATDIKDFPFPAVTICNMNQVKRSFVNGLKTERDRTILDSICSQGDQLNATFSPDSVIEGKWSYVRQFLLNASQSCEDMLRMCRYARVPLHCTDIFQSLLTDEGLCCTFNAVHSKLIFKDYNDEDHFESSNGGYDEIVNWSPELGYKTFSNSSYPRPVAGAGSHMGLSLVLNADFLNYYCSSASSAGFKVLLHSPIEAPKVANFGFFIKTGTESKVVITPKISDASNMIRKVPLLQRQCIFASEANLSYFNTYSRKNCEMECVSILVEKTCGCVLYYMPRNFTGSSICNRKKALCYEKVLYDIDHSGNSEFSCSCLPACFEFNYNKEMSVARLGYGSFQTQEEIFVDNGAEFVTNNIAVVHIFFVDNAFRSYTKGELIGFTDFLSGCGGLLGLFMGFSVISLIEIIYFLSLRPFCALKRFKNNYQTENIVNVAPKDPFLLIGQHNPEKENKIPRIFISKDKLLLAVKNKVNMVFSTMKNALKHEQEVETPFPYCE